MLEDPLCGSLLVPATGLQCPGTPARRGMGCHDMESDWATGPLHPVWAKLSRGQREGGRHSREAQGAAYHETLNPIAARSAISGRVVFTADDVALHPDEVPALASTVSEDSAQNKKHVISPSATKKKSSVHFAHAIALASSWGSSVVFTGDRVAIVAAAASFSTPESNIEKTMKANPHTQKSSFSSRRQKKCEQESQRKYRRV